MSAAGLELDLAQRIPDLLVLGIILLLAYSYEGETRQHRICHQAEQICRTTAIRSTFAFAAFLHLVDIRFRSRFTTSVTFH